MAQKIGIFRISLKKMENKWGKLEKLELEILEISPTGPLKIRPAQALDIIVN